jgi:NADPH:quinone reductase-like Zn-dependent oxidoreductase
LKAAICERYGELKLTEAEKPELADDGVLVRVHATSINRADWYGFLGAPLVARVMVGVRGPRSKLIGVDYAGVAEAVGKEVEGIRPGDEVYGARTGAFSDYVCCRVGVARKPANLSFEEAAAVPVAAITALQGLRDKGGLQAGQRVLVNGASGGVGTFAVQIAKALGGHVTAVCRTRNVEQARDLGADEVIDYTREDFTRGTTPYDLIFDNAGTHSWRQCCRVLTPSGTLVAVGAQMKNKLFSPLGHIAATLLASCFSRRKGAFFIAKVNRPDLELLRDWIEAGKVRPVIERRFEFAELEQALRYMGEGHARAKLVVTL